MSPLDVTHFSDPGCPWAYSASPALAVLHWRYGDQLRWRHVMIGLTEAASQYEARGYTPLMMARGYGRFRRRGMPFSTQPRPRVAGTARACRAVIATRLTQPELELAAFRALQFAWFTTPMAMDDDGAIAVALRRVPELDGEHVVGLLDDPGVTEAYEAGKAEARTAAGSPAELQGKTADTDGAMRYTAPSLVFEHDGRRLEAGGFQPVEAYDLCIANLDPSLSRRRPPHDVGQLLDAFPHGLTAAEVAACLAAGNDAPDVTAAEDALVELVAGGQAIHEPLGDGALWSPARAASREQAA